MLPRRLLRLSAIVLLALMGVLTSGVPSHHHGEAGRVPILEDAGHHGHGIQLVDQADRLTSDGVVAALPSAPLVEVGDLAPVTVGTDVPAIQPVATGRAPPSDRPRAPPLSV